jgi:uncharacterized protein (UPF0335 family)
MAELRAALAEHAEDAERRRDACAARTDAMQDAQNETTVNVATLQTQMDELRMTLDETAKSLAAEVSERLDAAVEFARLIANAEATVGGHTTELTTLGRRTSRTEATLGLPAELPATPAATDGGAGAAGGGSATGGVQSLWDRLRVLPEVDAIIATCRAQPTHDDLRRSARLAADAAADAFRRDVEAAHDAQAASAERLQHLEAALGMRIAAVERHAAGAAEPLDTLQGAVEALGGKVAALSEAFTTATAAATRDVSDREAASAAFADIVGARLGDLEAALGRRVSHLEEIVGDASRRGSYHPKWTGVSAAHNGLADADGAVIEHPTYRHEQQRATGVSLHQVRDLLDERLAGVAAATARVPQLESALARIETEAAALSATQRRLSESVHVQIVEATASLPRLEARIAAATSRCDADAQSLADAARERVQAVAARVDEVEARLKELQRFDRDSDAAATGHVHRSASVPHAGVAAGGAAVLDARFQALADQIEILRASLSTVATRAAEQADAVERNRGAIERLRRDAGAATDRESQARTAAMAAVHAQLNTVMVAAANVLSPQRDGQGQSPSPAHAAPTPPSFSPSGPRDRAGLAGDALPAHDASSPFAHPHHSAAALSGRLAAVEAAVESVRREHESARRDLSQLQRASATPQREVVHTSLSRIQEGDAAVRGLRERVERCETDAAAARRLATEAAERAAQAEAQVPGLAAAAAAEQVASVRRDVGARLAAAHVEEVNGGGGASSGVSVARVDAIDRRLGDLERLTGRSPTPPSGEGEDAHAGASHSGSRSGGSRSVQRHSEASQRGGMTPPAAGQNTHLDAATDASRQPHDGHAPDAALAAVAALERRVAAGEADAAESERRLWARVDEIDQKIVQALAALEEELDDLAARQDEAARRLSAERDRAPIIDHPAATDAATPARADGSSATAAAAAAASASLGEFADVVEADLRALATRVERLEDAVALADATAAAAQTGSGEGRSGTPLSQLQRSGHGAATVAGAQLEAIMGRCERLVLEALGRKANVTDSVTPATLRAALAALRQELMDLVSSTIAAPLHSNRGSDANAGTAATAAFRSLGRGGGGGYLGAAPGSLTHPQQQQPQHDDRSYSSYDEEEESDDS